VLPPDVNTCFDGSNECGNNVFCAYHSSMTDGSNTVLYANIPTYLAKQDPKGCQDDGNSEVQKPNGDQIGDVTSKYMSHEDNETITDPLGTAWWSSNSGNEDGDQCNFFGSFDPPAGQNPDAFKPTLGGSATAGTLYDQLINSNQYYIQTEWSNGDVNCEAQPNATGVTITNDFTAQAQSNDAASLTPTGSSSDGYSSVTWSFGDGQRQFDNSGAAPSSVTHTYAAAGTYTVTLTVVDPKGNLQTATHQVTVGEAPVAAFTHKPKKPSAGQRVHFNATSSSDPNTGGTITSYSWKFGDGKTATGAKVTHKFKKKGTYKVTLTITDSSGLTTKITHKVRVT
jgi:PKD repeat protein